MPLLIRTLSSPHLSKSFLLERREGCLIFAGGSSDERVKNLLEAGEFTLNSSCRTSAAARWIQEKDELGGR